MSPDPRSLAERVSAETGLEFIGTEGRDASGNRWLEICPAGHPSTQTFTLRTVVGWRRIDVYFRPGSFAGELMMAMGSADETARQTFSSILNVCQNEGAEVALSVNGNTCDPDESTIWTKPWRSLEFSIRRGMLPINQGDTDADTRQIELWLSRAAAAIVALLPLQGEDQGQAETTTEVSGLPEGAKIRVEVNRYERDRRNRAAALAIHGYLCKACDLDMGARYGPEAAGLIEVHHVTPVSEVGAAYIINPKTDLVPLCPNCHAVAHRRSPPFSLDELRGMQRLV